MCGSLSLCAHSIEEMTARRAGAPRPARRWCRPLDLSMQGPTNYDGPGDRALD
ncbi:hypothetical protein [Nonomuraea dietziae]|uniref:hypothetical protein n=1 Tax=Nonomuraea dietziae TaxID=65515 RepID=UPI0031E02B7D